MQFNVNSPILFIMVGVLIAAVLGQSVYFLVRAMKRARELGIEKKVVSKTISSSAIFTVAPAVAILVGVISLSRSLGTALPWLRLSIIGSLSYETVAATNSLNALGISAATQVSDPSDFVTVVWVMTLGIIIGLVLTPFVTKKIQGGMKRIENMDKKWSEILNNSLFLGMISAFLGFVFCDVSDVFVGKTAGLIPVLVMFVSMIAMLLCGLLSKTLKQRWITDYALPFSLVSGMAAAVPITAWLG